MFVRFVGLKAKSTMIWDAVVAGDCRKLHKLLDGGSVSSSLGTRADDNRWTLLHHAVMSRNLEVVQLVVEHCKPNVATQNMDGLTPLMLACEQSVAVEIIIYLLEKEQAAACSVEANDSISPLYYAVFQNRMDLAQELIAHDVKVGDVLLRDTSSPFYIVAIVTGNVEMLQCLLAAANVEQSFAADEDDRLAVLDVFAQRARYSAHKKVACFEIFYKLVHPAASVDAGSVRYNVEDILKPALLSMCSTSLIPYFIEVERKWEKREEIASLYRRLIPEYEVLAMFVLCECGSTSTESQEELSAILRDPFIRGTVSLAGGELELLYRYTINLDEEQSANDAKQLLQDFATFTKRMTLECLRNALQAGVQVALLTDHLKRDKPMMITREQFTAYQPIIDCMVSMCNNNMVDAIVEHMLNNEELLMRSDLVFPLLKHCSTLFMCHDTVVKQNNYQNPTRLFQYFMHLFGTWKAIMCFSTPQLPVFSLKRFARDAVREAVWYGIDAQVRAQKSTPFFDRLQSLDIPSELKGYLRYSDYTTLNYFLGHTHDTLNYFRETQ